MLSRLSQLLLLLFLFTSYIVASPIAKPTKLTLNTHDGGTSHSYSAGPHSPNTPPSSPVLKEQAKDTYEKAVAQAKEDKKKPPATGAALHIPNVGTYVSSSVKGGPDGPSDHTKDVAPNGCKLGNKGRCAEMGAIANAKADGHDVKGGTIAAYGEIKKGKKVIGHDFKPPCAGCQKDLEHHGVSAVKERREVEFEA
ncbi:hypothetical protein B0O99DRAFT_689747 [Bisporella sp. PMI_857]|nr:hypothetical protein B0O99DRAFT_689747 [Bisporella sp. PMI_857]